MKINDTLRLFGRSSVRSRAGNEAAFGGAANSEAGGTGLSGGSSFGSSGKTFAASLGALDFTDRVAKAKAAGEAAEQAFVSWTSMTVAERVRSMVLERHDLTEKDLEALPKEGREVIEQEIIDAIKQAYGCEGWHEATSAPADAQSSTSLAAKQGEDAPKEPHA